jgi:hypothetical protein
LVEAWYGTEALQRQIKKQQLSSCASGTNILNQVWMLTHASDEQTNKQASK